MPEDITLETTASEETPVVEADQGEVREESAPQEKEDSLLSGKFKSEEERDAAYKEAQRQMHLTNQERAELLRTMQSLKTTPQSEPSYDDGVELLKSVIKEAISETERPRKIEEVFNAFSSSYPDVGDYEQDVVRSIQSLMERNPDVAARIANDSQLLQDQLDTAYWAAKGRGSPKTMEEARKQGVEEAYRNQTRKQEAKVESGDYASQKSTTVITRETVNQMIADGTYEQNREQILKTIASNGGVLPDE